MHKESRPDYPTNVRNYYAVKSTGQDQKMKEEPARTGDVNMISKLILYQDFWY